MTRKHAKLVAAGQADPKNETELMRVVKHELNTSKRCRLLRNNVGLDESHGVLYGLGKGSADLVGVLTTGQSFAIETKMDKGVVSDKQIAWWRAAYKWNVRGGVARSLAGAWRLLEEAERGQTYTELADYE